MTTNEIARPAGRYVKMVKWSDEDGCFIGSAPPLIGQCCHGQTENEVLRQLGVIVEDVLEMKLKYGDPIPASTAGKKFSGKFLVRLSSDLHRKVAVMALSRGKSLNDFVIDALTKA